MYVKTHKFTQGKSVIKVQFQVYRNYVWSNYRVPNLPTPEVFQSVIVRDRYFTSRPTLSKILNEFQVILY